jgi:hypothetical protein
VGCRLRFPFRAVHVIVSQMFWRHDLASSGVGNSSAALVERAPYNDAEESEPVEGRSREIQRTLTAPLPGDDPQPEALPHVRNVAYRAFTSTPFQVGLYFRFEVAARRKGTPRLARPTARRAQAEGGGAA